LHISVQFSFWSTLLMQLIDVCFSNLLKMQSLEGVDWTVHFRSLSVEESQHGFGCRQKQTIIKDMSIKLTTA